MALLLSCGITAAVAAFNMQSEYGNTLGAALNVGACVMCCLTFIERAIARLP